MATDSSSGEMPPIWYIGQHETASGSSPPDDTLREAQDLGYDMAAVPITTPDFQSRVLATLQQHLDATPPNQHHLSTALPSLPALTPQDSALSPDSGAAALLGRVSPWLDLGSRDPAVAQVSRAAFGLEVAWAAFCGLQNVLVPGPRAGGDAVQFARAVLAALAAGPLLGVNVLLPMSGELELDGLDGGAGVDLAELARAEFASSPEDEHEDEEESGDEFRAWQVWDTVRGLCNYNSRLSIALEISRQPPSLQLQNRWYSEPVRMLVFPRTTFLRNAKGYPVLHKTHQRYLTRVMRLRLPPWILLGEVGATDGVGADSATAAGEPTPAEASGRRASEPVPHLRYMRHLQQTQPARPAIERFGQGYQDYIQSPLQPLTDNLESVTYEVFERDPVKYDWYERATALALRDVSARLGPERRVVVAVVGAGRGPLVSKALLASRSSGVPVSCWAVEKNPNAFVHLQRRNVSDRLWDGQVTVVKSDMRAWAGPVVEGETRKVDILISELLGSFADNELSPECLDGVQHVLDPDHGISIPQSYSAHVTPIATPRLYNDLLSRPGTDKWEMPVVVMLQQYDYLSVQAGEDGVPDVKQTWSFSHPLPAEVLRTVQRRAEHGGSGGEVGGEGRNEHNERWSKVKFGCQRQSVCHGLAGYFETVLYAAESGEKVELSTNPVTMEEKSRDMISWFPIFFPLKTPLHVPADAEIEVNIWRSTDDRKVWYEWIVEVFDGTKRRRRIGVSELHSSHMHGCLM